MKNPLVSIITPTYNSEKYLESTIQSIVNQSYKNIEYIIVDGGSTDKTLSVIDHYKQFISTVITEPKRGMYSAVNRGIQHASGEIIAYLNSDDLYYDETIDFIVKTFNENQEIDLIYGSERVIDGEGKRLYDFRFPNYNWSMFVSGNFSTIGQPCSFWRKKIHARIGYFDESMKMAADYDFFCKAGKEFSILNVSKILGAYRIHGNSLTAENHPVSQAEIKKIHARYIKSPIRIFLRPLVALFHQIIFRTMNINALVRKLYLSMFRQ